MLTLRMHIYTHLHKLYVHTLCVLDSIWQPGWEKGFFLMDKACHVRWPCVSWGGIQSDTQQLLFYPPPSDSDRFLPNSLNESRVAPPMLPLPATTSSQSLTFWNSNSFCDPRLHWSCSPVMSSLGGRQQRVQDRSSDARHQLTWSALKSAGRPVRLMPRRATSMSFPAPPRIRRIFCCGPPRLSCQIFDSRRPRVAPSEARSLGSLALEAS